MNEHREAKEEDDVAADTAPRTARTISTGSRIRLANEPPHASLLWLWKYELINN